MNDKIISTLDRMLDCQITEEEKAVLYSEPPISDYRRNKLEKDAKKNWDLFYKRNSNHFFKDRHWLTREFSIISAMDEV